MNYNLKKMKKRKGKKLMKFQYLLCIYYWTEKSWFSNTGGETIGNCAIALGTPRSISSKLRNRLRFAECVQ